MSQFSKTCFTVIKSEFVMHPSQHSCVDQWLGCWTCHQQFTCSTLSCRSFGCNPGQIVYTCVPLSPSSINWFRPMSSDALWFGRHVGLVSQSPCMTDNIGLSTSWLVDAGWPPIWKTWKSQGNRKWSAKNQGKFGLSCGVLPPLMR